MSYTIVVVGEGQTLSEFLCDPSRVDTFETRSEARGALVGLSHTILPDLTAFPTDLRADYNPVVSPDTLSIIVDENPEYWSHVDNAGEVWLILAAVPTASLS